MLNRSAIGWYARTLLAFAACAGAAGAASAQTIYYPSSASVKVQVAASVAARCGFASGAAPSATLSAAEIDAAGFSFDVPFTLDCTTPMRVAVVSANGGLAAATAAAGGYSAKAPYDVTLNLVGNGATASANAKCAAAALASGSTCGFVGPASATQGLRLASASSGQTGSYLRLSAPAYSGTTPLVSGTYSDTLIVTVSAAP